MYKSDYITSWLEISPFPPGKAKVWRVKTKNDYDTFQPDKKMKSKGNILAFFFFLVERWVQNPAENTSTLIFKVFIRQKLSNILKQRRGDLKHHGDKVRSTGLT